MYKELSLEEINKFADKYLKEFNEPIKSISCISYRLTKEYLINGHYFVVVSLFKREYKELLK